MKAFRLFKSSSFKHLKTNHITQTIESGYLKSTAEDPSKLKDFPPRATSGKIKQRKTHGRQRRPGAAAASA
ncbi:hypothetical protein Bca52824_017964 [Brassica carinata]|uniref:Uncharacterized protein n=1 Tax=Brassica carinata TaxID=52824 RepID=A0A8X8AXY1_BRACI|nr:hypothetical protein Bca52824_017964 [Brassica carinata]